MICCASRKARREEELPPLGEVKANAARYLDPEEEMIMADSVGLALLVILETLSPAERLAFVLHDIFGVSFSEIAIIVGRSEDAAKKLASRARQRVQGKQPSAGVSARSIQVVEAFLAAARTGDLGVLLQALDADVVRRADADALPAGAELEVRGARLIITETLTNTALARLARIALVDGAPGLIVSVHRQLVAALCFTIEEGRIKEIEVIANRARLNRLELAEVNSSDA